MTAHPAQPSIRYYHANIGFLGIDTILPEWRLCNSTQARCPTLHKVDDVRHALTELDPLWQELFPAEHARIVQLLVERVDIGDAGLSVLIRIDGLTGLARDMAVKVGRAA